LGYRFTLPGRFPAGLAADASSIKKMLLTNFCNCKSRHEHLLERSILEVSTILRPGARPMEPKPQRTTRVVVHLTVHNQLRWFSIHAPFVV
jgi:hypothetical protein